MTRVNILRCDGRDCLAQVPALDGVVMTMREVRREAAVRGWSGRRGRDYCPRHNRTRSVNTAESALLNEAGGQ